MARLAALVAATVQVPIDRGAHGRGQLGCHGEIKINLAQIIEQGANFQVLGLSLILHGKLPDFGLIRLEAIDVEGYAIGSWAIKAGRKKVSHLAQYRRGVLDIKTCGHPH